MRTPTPESGSLTRAQRRGVLLIAAICIVCLGVALWRSSRQSEPVMANPEQLQAIHEIERLQQQADTVIGKDKPSARAQKAKQKKAEKRKSKKKAKPKKAKPQLPVRDHTTEEL